MERGVAPSPVGDLNGAISLVVPPNQGNGMAIVHIIVAQYAMLWTNPTSPLERGVQIIPPQEAKGSFKS